MRFGVFVHELLLFNSFFLYKMMDHFFGVGLDDQESEEGWGGELPLNSVGNTLLGTEAKIEVQYQESANVSILYP